MARRIGSFRLFAGELEMALGFRGVDRDVSMLLPPDLRDWLPPDHLAWLVLEVVDQLDLSGPEAGDGSRLNGLERKMTEMPSDLRKQCWTLVALEGLR